MINRYFIFVLFLLSVCTCFSQITLNENDFPKAQDTVRFSEATNPNLDYSKSGTGITWDFSNLAPNNQFVREFTSIGFSPVQLTFGILAPAPYRASYFIPENTLPLDQLNGFLPISLSDARSYQKSTNNSITKLGYSIKISGADVAFKSDTIETKYKFPMDYQQVFTTKGYTFIDLNPAADFKVKQYRNVTSTVDGYGQLILPIGTFEVLRLKREILEIDSIYQSFFGFPVWVGIPPIRTTEYEWVGQNKKDVLLKIVVSNANGINQIQSIEYQDIYRNLLSSVGELENNVTIYPTFADNYLHVNSNFDIVNFEILDMQGEIKLIGNLESKSSTINLTSLNSGLYFVRVKSDLGYSTYRFIKQ